MEAAPGAARGAGLMGSGASSSALHRLWHQLITHAARRKARRCLLKTVLTARPPRGVGTPSRHPGPGFHGVLWGSSTDKSAGDRVHLCWRSNVPMASSADRTDSHRPLTQSPDWPPSPGGM